MIVNLRLIDNEKVGTNKIYWARVILHLISGIRTDCWLVVVFREHKGRKANCSLSLSLSRKKNSLNLLKKTFKSSHQYVLVQTNLYWDRIFIYLWNIYRTSRQVIYLIWTNRHLRSGVLETVGLHSYLVSTQVKTRIKGLKDTL